MRSILATVAAVVILVGCTPSTVPAYEPATAEAPGAASHATVRPQEHTRVRAPYILTVEGPVAPDVGATVKVVARLELAAPAPAPIVLSIEALDGAVDGIDSDEEIPAGAQGSIEHSWELRVVDPSAIVAVTAQMQGEGFGATARRELSFAGPMDTPAATARPGSLLRPKE